MSNIVYIATSLDGYIADKKGQLDWLNDIPNPDNSDSGFSDFLHKVDAIIMGRKTYEAVLSFGCDWPYTKPVYVLSNSLKKIPQQYQDRVELISGAPKEILQHMHKIGAKTLYIDGGITIQSFLEEDLIDEMIITTVPILLGGGYRLFGMLDKPLDFELESSRIILKNLVQNTYKRKVKI